MRMMEGGEDDYFLYFRRGWMDVCLSGWLTDKDGRTHGQAAAPSVETLFTLVIIWFAQENEKPVRHSVSVVRPDLRREGPLLAPVRLSVLHFLSYLHSQRGV